MAMCKTKHGPLSRLKALFHLPRFNHVVAGNRGQARVTPEVGSGSAERIGEVNMSKWKKFNSRRFGITPSMIPRHALSVLSVLRCEGFDAYLVGGCVRDLILHRIPKDFDVITNASLQKVKSQFRQAQIVGRRFPICIVRIRGFIVEVSSFKTVAVQNAEEDKVISLPPIPRGCSGKEFIRWRDSMRRDFTVNSQIPMGNPMPVIAWFLDGFCAALVNCLFLDPFDQMIYDYTNGIEDLKSLTLRTLIPAKSSFEEDSARMLRGLRIAARLGLKFSKEVEDAISSLSSSIKCLHQDRIMLEINYMLSYGAAEPSLRLLWRFRLLEILLPFQAAYLDLLDGDPCSHSSSMLMKLFSNMDKLVSCGQPAHSILWVGLLAFHVALVCQPQNAEVVWAFASILLFGWKKGVEFARTKANRGVHLVPEISGSSSNCEAAELEQRVIDLTSLVKESVAVLSDSESLSESMSRYPLASCYGAVFVSKKVAKDVHEIFQVLVKGSQKGECSSKVSLKLRETRTLLGRIIMETMSGEVLPGAKTQGMEIADLRAEMVMDPPRQRRPYDGVDNDGGRPLRTKQHFRERCGPQDTGRPRNG